MTRQQKDGLWTWVERVAGLSIVAAVIVLRSLHLLEWSDAQLLLGIAACLLGVIRLLRGGGER